MSATTFITTNLQTAEWRIAQPKTDMTKAVITPKMIHDIGHDDPDRARGILATLYHNDRPQFRRLCAEYCQQLRVDYDTLIAKWENWVLTGQVASAVPEHCKNCSGFHSTQDCPEVRGYLMCPHSGVAALELCHQVLGDILGDYGWSGDEPPSDVLSAYTAVIETLNEMGRSPFEGDETDRFGKAR